MVQLPERQAILEKMRSFDYAEHIYKELYSSCPGKFEVPISDWDEFRLRLESCGYKGNIPDSAPSPITSWISENFFFNENQDVAIVKNDRFCPPFWHQLEFIKVVYIVSGSAVLFTENGKTVIEEGNLCIVPPKVRNAAFSYDDGDIVINIIIKRSTFEKSFASLLAEASMLSDYLWQILYRKNGGDVIYFTKKSETDITDVVLQIYGELNLEENTSNIMLKSYLMLFFGQMLRYYSAVSTPDKRVSSNGPHLSSIMKYMSEHRRTVTLPELSLEFHFSEGYLSRYLKNQTGEPFNILLKEMRMEQAAVMLQNSNVSVEEVCGAVGYSDVSRFYRNFKERYGMTPAQFRRAGSV